MKLRCGWLALLGSVWVSGCAGFGYTGAARDLAPEALSQQPGWIGVQGVTALTQRDQHGCGATALAMIMRYWDPRAPIEPLVQRAVDVRLSAAELRDLARQAGFAAFVVEGTVNDLVHELEQGRPMIVGVAKPTVTGAVAHYEVVVGIHPEQRRIATVDPARGWRSISYAGFVREWLATGSVLLVVFPVDPVTAVAWRSARHQELRLCRKV